MTSRAVRDHVVSWGTVFFFCESLLYPYAAKWISWSEAKQTAFGIFCLQLLMILSFFWRLYIILLYLSCLFFSVFLSSLRCILHSRKGYIIRPLDMNCKIIPNLQNQPQPGRLQQSSRMDYQRHLCSCWHKKGTKQRKQYQFILKQYSDPTELHFILMATRPELVEYVVFTEWKNAPCTAPAA